MSSKQNLNEVKEQLSSLKQQYNSLLEKNQNDLIKIKQKQKTFNETIAQLKRQKQQQQKKYKQEIDTLVLQIQKLKYQSNQSSDRTLRVTAENDLTVQVKNQKAEISELAALVELKKQRIEHLQENARKMMDQNIQLTAQKEQQKRMNEKLQREKSQYLNKIAQLTSKIKQQKQNKNAQIQTEGDHIISKKEHEKIIAEFNHQIKNLNQELQRSQESAQMLKKRLMNTNQELKRFIERDKKNSAIIKRKNEEINSFETEVETYRKKASKARKIPTQQSCAKCKEWEQQNKLLKEMVKSVQTMVRVKQMEAERYKARELTNSKLIQKTERVQSKKSRGELPPLKKNS